MVVSFRSAERVTARLRALSSGHHGADFSLPFANEPCRGFTAIIFQSSRGHFGGLWVLLLEYAPAALNHTSWLTGGESHQRRYRLWTYRGCSLSSAWYRDRRLKSISRETPSAYILANRRTFAAERPPWALLTAQT